MKKIVSLLSLLCFLLTAKAQTDFEGKVIYQLQDPGKVNREAELTILFSPQKIRIRFKEVEKETTDKEEILINLDSGSIYILNTINNTYRIKKLKERTSDLPISNKTIAGYSTKALHAEPSGLSGLIGGLLGRSDMVFYVSDSLAFHFPQKFISNPELLMLSNQHIVLGAEFKMDYINDEYELKNDEIPKNENITITAKEVIPMSVNNEEFLIPPGYVNRQQIIPSVDSFVEKVEMDTTAAADTVVNVPVVKIPRAKKSVKKTVNPKKPAIKSSTAIRKP